MRYFTPELRNFGTFAGLTKGNNGSCPDGNGDNDQFGGGFGKEPCGSSSGNKGATNKG